MRYEIYKDSSNRWYVNDNVLDANVGGIFQYEGDAQKFANSLNK